MRELIHTLFRKLENVNQKAQSNILDICPAGHLLVILCWDYYRCALLSTYLNTAISKLMSKILVINIYIPIINTTNVSACPCEGSVENIVSSSKKKNKEKENYTFRNKKTSFDQGNRCNNNVALVVMKRS